MNPLLWNQLSLTRDRVESGCEGAAEPCLGCDPSSCFQVRASQDSLRIMLYALDITLLGDISLFSGLKRIIT